MMKRSKHTAAIALVAAVYCTNVWAQQAVIPGAFGFGTDTQAGRGGAIIQVTSLADSGSGSLRACVESSGPRICVFEVSGRIELKSQLTAQNPNLTIAGQTAPDPGITLSGAPLAIKTSDVLVQHIAIRAGDEADGSELNTRDSLKVNGANSVRNIVIDHCSISWGVDENSEIWGGFDNVTISNSVIAEPLRGAIDPDSRGYGTLIGSSDGKVSLIGNLYATSHARNPRSGAKNFVFVNNVVYNSYNNLNLYNQGGITTNNSIVGNVFINGPVSAGNAAVRLSGLGEGNRDNQMLPGTRIYLADNSNGSSVADQWSLVSNQSPESSESLKSSTAPTWPTGLIALQTANNAVKNYVLDNAGSRPAARDSVDTKIIADVRNGTGRLVECVSGCTNSAGGWPQLAENRRTLSIPDNPNGDDDGDGYTNVEEWLHAMAAEVEGQPPGTPTEPVPNPPELL